jgi:hypothetical protein
MSTPLLLALQGVGVWAPGLPGWSAAAVALCGNVDSGAALTRPSPSLLPPAERRRAPDSVLLAIEVAQQACVMAGFEPRALPHVFASSYGDLPINDYLCATLAQTPLDVSPTKFHNSVHNAPAGYWAIATGCQESSTALSAADATFGAGLLEAALLAHSEARPVLLVVYDVAATGPIADTVACEQPFAAAFVLAPARSGALATLRLSLDDALAALAPGPDLLHALYPTNPAARSLPLLTALARRATQTQCVKAGPQLHLSLEIRFD